MHVMVLGGAGEIGAAIVAALARVEKVDQITVADRNTAGAQVVAARVGAHAVHVDLDDPDGFRAALGGIDVLANATGPFYRFGTAALRAAIDTGTHYVDVCDDPHPTLEMLEQDAAARRAGVTALIGMGASPGIANVLAAAAGRRLDTVTDLVTGWNIDAAHAESGGATAAVRHGIHEISGTVPRLRHGRIAEGPALEPVDIDYPGIGRIRGLTFGHPEAVTGHLAFPSLVHNVNVAVCDRVTGGALRALRVAVDDLRVPVDAAAAIAARAQRLLPADPAKILRRGTPPPIFAVARGELDGRPETVAVGLAQVPGFDMATNTAVPLAAAVPLLDAAQPGVHVPETLLDPDEFFAAYAPFCIGEPDPSAVAVTTATSYSDQENAEALSRSLLTALLGEPPAVGAAGVHV